jgi:hypothetical protein
MKLELKNDENYAATFVTLNKFQAIDGADNIKHAIINGRQIIVSTAVEAGVTGVVFPIEAQISAEFLWKNNLFSDPMKNEDQSKKSYFGDKGRVRCVSLRGAKSEGFFIELASFQKWANIDPSEWTIIKDGASFDTINEKEICRKYVVVTTENGSTKNPSQKKGKEVDRILPDQYRLHYKTSHLAQSLHMVHPNDYIVISDKWHGTSLSCGRVLLKKNLSIFEKIKKFFFFPVETVQYENIYASRTVIKSLKTGKDSGFYKEDVWKLAFDSIKHALTDGIQIYAEIVGYTESGAMIQKNYDYGCGKGEFAVAVYRVTHTTHTGEVTEYSMQEVVKFCKDNRINHVPIFYQGIAKNLFHDLDITSEDDWRQEFYLKLKNSFNLEKKCKVCKNKVPAEGIVLRNDSKMMNALKLKAFAFQKLETKMLDEGIVDMESAGE